MNMDVDALLKSDASRIAVPQISPQAMLERVKTLAAEKGRRVKKRAGRWPLILTGSLLVMALTMGIIFASVRPESFEAQDIEAGFSISQQTEEIPLLAWNIGIKTTGQKKKRKKIEVYFGHRDFTDDFQRDDPQYDGDSPLRLVIERHLYDSSLHWKSSSTVYEYDSTINELLARNDFVYGYKGNVTEYPGYFADEISADELPDDPAGRIWYWVTLESAEEGSLGIVGPSEDSSDWNVSAGWSPRLSYEKDGEGVSLRLVEKTSEKVQE